MPCGIILDSFVFGVEIVVFSENSADSSSKADTAFNPAFVEDSSPYCKSAVDDSSLLQSSWSNVGTATKVTLAADDEVSREEFSQCFVSLLLVAVCSLLSVMAVRITLELGRNDWWVSFVTRR